MISIKSLAMKNLLLIASLFGLIMLNSCGEKTKQKEETTTEAKEENQQPENSKKSIVFFGTSLTAAMGLDPEEGYPAHIQRKIDSLDINYEVVNAGLSGETTASGLNRLDWVLNQQVDVFVLELGANDGLRGVPIEETRKNLQEIIDRVENNNPGVQIILAGMQIPPNMGEEYTREFREMFPELARENDLVLIPFLLEGVAGDPNLNQQDGIHPTAEGQKIMAETVWEVLEEEL